MNEYKYSDMRKGILLLIAVFATMLCVSAQETVQTDTVSVKVYFRQGYSSFEPAFRDNGIRLQAFVARLREIGVDTTQRLHHVCIVGAASPEGTAKMNERLSEKRAASLKTWLEENFSVEGMTYESHAVGVDWEGLTLLVEESDMPYRDEVLDILYNTPEWVIRDGKVVDGRKRQLGMLRGGRAWWYMEEHFFPELRSTSMQLFCEITRQPRPTPVPVTQPDTVTVVVRDTVQQVLRDTLILRDTVMLAPAVKERRNFYMAVKTNMLYDVLLVPNIGVEFYLGKGWTVGANWMYAWWKSDTRHRYWRTYGGDLNVRKYFGSRTAAKPLTGHHLGVYGQMVTYDFELGGTGYLGDRWSWGTGIEYGYSLPVAKRLNIDFAIGIGYLGGEYKVYDPVDNHYVWRETRQRHWFGPTRAEITLVWLIGRGNCNKGKGGAR